MRSGPACDEWNRFEDDFRLARDLGHTAHRFSIEWSRIEPQEGQWDSSALEHYARVIASLRSKGIEPIVTLNHFTLPLWLARRGGWLPEKTPELFARYAGKVGGDVHYWITLNEPLVYTYKGYISGEWPPGIKSSKEAIEVFQNLLRGHVLAYEKIKETYRLKGWKEPKIGIAQSVLIFRACSDSSLRDRVAARFRHWMFNHLFVQALVRGRAYCIGLFNVHLPKAKTLDFIGLNYYTRDFVLHHGFGFPGILGQACTATAEQNRHTGKNNFLSWEIYPKGLYTFLKDFSRYKLPLLVSENGIGTDDDSDSGFGKEDLASELTLRAMAAYRIYVFNCGCNGFTEEELKACMIKSVSTRKVDMLTGHITRSKFRSKLSLEDVEDGKGVKSRPIHYALESPPSSFDIESKDLFTFFTKGSPTGGI
jgi:beta-glucosidase